MASYIHIINTLLLSVLVNFFYLNTLDLMTLVFAVMSGFLRVTAKDDGIYWLGSCSQLFSTFLQECPDYKLFHPNLIFIKRLILVHHSAESTLLRMYNTMTSINC